MGSYISHILQRCFSSVPSRILLLGLDAAGKTTVLYYLKLGHLVQAIPTIGFNVETVTCNRATFVVWDVSGQDKIRPLWRHYYPGTNGVVFVVDSADRERMLHVREELRAICEEEELRGVPLLVLANKQDLKGAMSDGEMRRELGLEGGTRWKVQKASALTGEGL